MLFYFGKLNLSNFELLFSFASSMINPLSIGTCLAKSSLVFHNLLLTMTFYFFMTCKIILSSVQNFSNFDSLDQLIPFLITLCLASSISLYPVVLIAPALLQFSKNRSMARLFLVISLFLLMSVGILFLNFFLNHQSWSFIESTYSFM